MTARIRGLLICGALCVCLLGCGHGGTGEIRLAGGAPVAVSSLEGEASWYGAKFAGRPTASGEPFDPRAMTAAHASLPFGTRVRVHCPETGKSVDVRINDRFPGTRGRVIDLSEAAFARLAPLARGVVQVRLEIVNP